MLGELNTEQIRHVLLNQTIGRIGCHADGRTYVVPITFVYHEGCIYCHSREGLKIDMMKKNPTVCFEVDIMENMANWRSVILWGEYEELVTPEDQETARNLLKNRFMPLLSSETVSRRPSQLPHPIEKGKKAIQFRIRITEQTGRFEKST